VPAASVPAQIGEPLSALTNGLRLQRALALFLPHQRVTEPSHFAGVVGGPRPVSLPIPAAVPAELLRPLCDYEQLTVLSSDG
jgi:hypothetical protein